MQDTDAVIQSLIVGGRYSRTTLFPFLSTPPHINILLTIALLTTELLQHSKLQLLWLPWQAEKKLTNKIGVKFGNLWPVFRGNVSKP